MYSNHGGHNDYKAKLLWKFTLHFHALHAFTYSLMKTNKQINKTACYNEQKYVHQVTCILQLHCICGRSDHVMHVFKKRKEKNNNNSSLPCCNKQMGDRK